VAHVTEPRGAHVRGHEPVPGARLPHREVTTPGPSMSTCLQRKEEQKKREGREVSNCRVQFGTVTLSWAGGTMPTDGVMKPLPGSGQSHCHSHC